MVVVLGVSETGLSAMRLLGRRGVRCWGIDASFDHPGFSSRYCDRRICVSESVSAPELAAVLSAIARERGDRPVLLPTSDRFVRLLRALRSDLGDRFQVALPPSHVVDDMLDKARFSACAERSGLRSPRTAPVSDAGGLEEAARSVGFPVIVKPRASDRRPAGLPKARVLQDEAELRAFEATHRGAIGPELVVQEYVPGGDFQHLSVAVALDSHARPVASFVARKRRQGNRGAGVGTFVESHHDDEAASVARRFLSRIGYVGVAEMELKRHGTTGELFAIEVNPRLWSQVMLPAALGLDFALLAYRIARGAAPSGELPSPRGDVAWQDLLGDSYWTFCSEGYFWRGDVSASRWLMETLSSCVHPFFEWRDPMPAMKRLWQEASDMAAKAAAREAHGGARHA